MDQWFHIFKELFDFKHKILYPAKLTLNYRSLKFCVFFLTYKNLENLSHIVSSELSGNMLQQKKGVNKNELHLRSRVQ